MALEHHPITTSAVILLNNSQAPPNPPPSPPSPATPCDRATSPPLDDLPPISPPDLPSPSLSFDQRLANAVHVLGTEATALSHLTRLYETDPVARKGFNAAVTAITRPTIGGGKLVVTGIGKSGYICQKLVATLKSLGIPADYLHPTEALHGDIGGINRMNDTLLMITFSGSTPELLELLPHLPELPLIIMTRHTTGSTCQIVKRRPDSILLPAPIHISENDSHGVNAPTTSTTVCLALCDALAIVLANHYHKDIGAVFSKFHPGGAIGAAFRGPQKISDISINIASITEMDNSTATGGHVLMAAFRSKTRWLRQGDVLLPPSRIERIRTEYLDEPASCIQGLMVPQVDWVEIPEAMELADAKEWIRARRILGEKKYKDDGILVTVLDKEVTGVLEIGALMKG